MNTRKNLSRSGKRPRPAKQLPNTWTVGQAAEWADVPKRTLYRMIKAEIVPCIIPIGEPQEQKLAKAHTGTRNRTCFRFLIPRVAFMKWWENYTGKTGAAA